MASGDPPGRVFMVAGHEVQFPHEAYGTQLGFMNKARASAPSQIYWDLYHTWYEVTRKYSPHTSTHPSCIPDLSAFSSLQWVPLCKGLQFIIQRMRCNYLQRYCVISGRLGSQYSPRALDPLPMCLRVPCSGSA